MILGQHLLPAKTLYIACRTMKQMVYCIKTLGVRVALAIGMAAAMGISLTVSALTAKTPAAWHRQLASKIEVMRAARPTAVNLG
ncbi:hypothetical protein DFAR_710028 [Desulfarculales bacterium]